MPAPDVSREEQQLVDLNRRLGEAERTRNRTFLAEVLADDLIFRRASGARVGKGQYLDEVMDPKNTYERLESKDAEVLLPGSEVALVSLRVEAKGRRGATAFEGTFRNTRLFLKQDGHWRCVSWFNTAE